MTDSPDQHSTSSSIPAEQDGETLGRSGRGPKRFTFKRVIVFLVLAVAYLLMPIDAIPELLLPGIGFIDDVAIVPLLAWLIFKGVGGRGGS